MATNTHFLITSRSILLAEGMFQIKVVEKIKTHILRKITIFRKSFNLWDKVEKHSRAWQATDDNMAHVYCSLGN